MENKKINVLLVEDELIVAMINRKELERKGYIVHHVVSGEDAIRVTTEENTSLDLVLMDIDLGDGLDGTQAAEKILRKKDIPIVFLSSHTEPDVVEKTEKITSYGYVVKHTGIVVLDASIKMDLKLFNAKMDRLRAEQALSIFSLAVDESSSAIGMSTPEGKHYYQNKAFDDMFGTIGEDATSTVFYDLVVGKKVFKTVASGEVFIGEVKMIGKAGNLLDIQLRAYPIKDYDSKIVGLVGVHQDITESKKAEIALIKSEEKLRRLVQSLHSGVVVHAPDTQILLSNDRASELLGLTVDQMMGKTAVDPSWKFIREDYSEMPLEEFPVNQVLTKRKPLRDQVVGINRPQTKDIVWVQISAFPEFDSNQELVQVVVTFVEITERKLAEEKLRSSNELFKQLFNFSPVGLSLNHMKKGTYLDVNQEFASQFHTTATEMIGKTPQETGYMMSEKSMTQFLDLMQKDGKVRNLKIGIHSSFGDEIPMLLSAEKVSLNGEECMLTSLQDITELVKAEKEIQRQLTEKDILLKEVHHRVKNNIANVEGLLVLQADSSTNQEVKLSLLDAVSRVKSMRHLFEKLMVGSFYKEVSMKQYIASLVQSIQSVYAESQQVEIETHVLNISLSPSLTTTIGIIINELMTNIFKYAFIGREAGKATISLDYSEDDLILTVWDNGVGMSNEIVHHKKYGFGLSIIKMMVEQLDGLFEIVRDNGTKVIIVI